MTENVLVLVEAGMVAFLGAVFLIIGALSLQWLFCTFGQWLFGEHDWLATSDIGKEGKDV